MSDDFFASNEPDFVPRSYLPQGTFGRMFRILPAYDPPGANDVEKTRFLERRADRMIELTDRSTSYDNTRIPAGYTYFGQFIDHDISFDTTSSLQRQNDPDKLWNFRTPRLDLDSVYSSGPIDMPYLYGPPARNNGATKLAVRERYSSGKVVELDLPRNAAGLALIGDPRNDENVMVSQLHVAFLRFHNNLVDRLSRVRPRPMQLFRTAQRLVRWHYQWLVINDFLRRVVGNDVVNSILGSRFRSDSQPNLRFFRWINQPFLPIEFSAAAFRFGHSMVRPKYDLNYRKRRVPLLAKKGQNVGGFHALRQSFTVQWDRFLPVGSDRPQYSRKIDTRLAQPLINALPGKPKGLARRNLLRGWRLGLPSGQAVARLMGLQPLSNVEEELPLWEYILLEAESRGGDRLGPVGANIVAEVLIGLVTGDDTSYLRNEPLWRPGDLVPKMGSQFQLIDLMNFAGMPISKGDLRF